MRNEPLGTARDADGDRLREPGSASFHAARLQVAVEEQMAHERVRAERAEIREVIALAERGYEPSVLDFDTCDPVNVATFRAALADVRGEREHIDRDAAVLLAQKRRHGRLPR